jgi:hypothetical protein
MPCQMNSLAHQPATSRHFTQLNWIIREWELLYDWRFITSSSWRQAPWEQRLIYFFQLNTCGCSPYVTCSLKRGRILTITADPGQRSHSRVRIPRDSRPYFSVSDSTLPQPGGPGPRIYIPQEQGGPVILSGTGFSFSRLVRLAGLRWKWNWIAKQLLLYKQFAPTE